MRLNSTLFKAASLACLLSLCAVDTDAQTNGNALSFDGTDDQVTLPAGIVSSLTGDVTFEAWIYWRGNSAWQRVFDFGSGTSSYLFLTPRANDGFPRFAILTPSSGGEQVLYGTAPLPNNTWTHIAVTITHASNTGRLYINGTLVATNPAMTLRPSSLNPTTQNWLGRSQYPDPFYNGNIEEFRISNTVRYTSNFSPSQTQLVNDANTVALYRFNEGTGQSVSDASGNNFNGVLGATAATESSDPTWIFGSILPVKFAGVSAVKNGNTVQLQWQATGTEATAYFEVQRANAGGSFATIGTVAANVLQRAYSYTDATAGVRNAYRIKAVEQHGKTVYSSTVLAGSDATAAIQVYPSLASSQLFVQLPSAADFALYTLEGRLVKKVSLNQSGAIDITSLTKGAYFLQHAGTKEVFRFVKQ